MSLKLINEVESLTGRDFDKLYPDLERLFWTSLDNKDLGGLIYVCNRIGLVKYKAA